jgi:hypothetical protein
MYTEKHAIYHFNTNDLVDRGVRLINCTFLNIFTYGTSGNSSVIKIYSGASDSSFNLSTCLFKNISSNSEGNDGGVITFYLDSVSNGDYLLNGCSFIDIKIVKSGIVLTGKIVSFIFSDNYFLNISCDGFGGVLNLI